MIDIFARPLGALLRLVYDALGNAGLDYVHVSAYALSIIITTVIFKLILMPLTLKQTKSMKAMQDIQPEIQKIQKKYKDDQQAISVKTMELYKEHKINPLGGCLPLLVQFPIIIAYFRVMQSPAEYVFKSKAVYEAINKGFLWVSDIGLAPGELVKGVVNEVQVGGFAIPLMAIFAAITTYFSNKSMTAAQPAANEQAASTQKTMNIMTPLIIFMFGFRYAVGLTLYWTVSNIFQMAQQAIVNKSMDRAKEEGN